MILAIDIGNTNIVVGCCKDNKVSFVERISTNHTATELEYAVSIKTILELYNIDFSEIDGAIISSVVPTVTITMKRAIKKITGCEAMIIGPGIKTGLSIVIDNPAQLGSDLVVDAVAGIHEYGAPIVFNLKKCSRVYMLFERTNKGDGGKAIARVFDWETVLDADFKDGWGIYYNNSLVYSGDEAQDIILSITPELENGKHFAVAGIMVS